MIKSSQQSVSALPEFFLKCLFKNLPDLKHVFIRHAMFGQDGREVALADK
jgi:hypothetical protein